MVKAKLNQKMSFINFAVDPKLKKDFEAKAGGLGLTQAFRQLMRRVASGEIELTIGG